MEDNIYSTYHYYMKTKKQKEAVDEIAPRIINAAERAIVGNVGDIKYTARTDVPYGGYWCNGQIVSKAELENVYQMLLDGKLQYVDMATYDSIISSKGSCGFFGLDTENQIFKVPTLTDVYIKSGQAALEFGAESLPNITGISNGYCTSGTENGTDTSGCIYNIVYDTGQGAASNGSWQSKFGIDASRSSSTYKNGAKVNPDHVKYRAYIVLFSSEKELAIANWTTQLNKLTEQLKKELIAHGGATIIYWD